MSSALHQGVWGTYGLEEADVRRLLSHKRLLDCLAELSGIPRAIHWAYKVLVDPDIMETVFASLPGFDTMVAARIRMKVTESVSAPDACEIWLVKALSDQRI